MIVMLLRLLGQAYVVLTILQAQRLSLNCCFVEYGDCNFIFEIEFDICLNPHVEMNKSQTLRDMQYSDQHVINMFSNWSNYWAIWHTVSFPLEEPVYLKNGTYNLDMEVDITDCHNRSVRTWIKTKSRNRTSPEKKSWIYIEGVIIKRMVSDR